MGQNIRSIKKAQAAQSITWAPYQPLCPAGERYFYDLLTCRASYDWSRGDIIMLTRVSDWLARADEYKHRLEMDGLTLINAKGTEVMNPMVTICDGMERRIVSTMVKLAIFSISASSQTGRGIEGKAAKEANRAALDGAHDDLVG